MRLHRLEVTAFGPFSGTEVVDFDALSDAGLFLLHGPTGAGKTSLLDAVCFALYGQVPGARAAGRPRLRSDHAPRDRAPQVQLELSLSGRRLEVTRSPEWQRPKRRGEGFTRQPAAVDVRELVDGEWVVRTARRSDEAGLLLTDLLGMGIEQFTQVVMLPQGDFAAFLRADAETRRVLLARLFSIDRFGEVEAWLSGERRRSAGLVESSDATLRDLVARAEQAASPLRREEHDEAGAEPGPSDRVARQLERAEAEASTCAAALQRAQDEALAAESDLAATRLLADRVQRLRQARQALAVVDEAADRHARQVEALARARRSAPCRGPLLALRAADDRVTASGKSFAAARRQLPTDLAVPGDASASAGGGGTGQAVTDEPLARAIELRQADLGRLDGAIELSTGVTQHRLRMDQLAVSHEAATTGVTHLIATHEAAVERVASWRRTVTRTGAANADLDAARQAVHDAKAVETAGRGLVRCRAEIEQGEQVLRDAVDVDQRALAALLDVRERRLDGIAAELARTLVDGQPCKVCGSAQHPVPADPAHDHVGRAEELAAGQIREAAAARRRLAERTVADLRAAAADLSARSRGTDADAATAAVSAAAGRVVDLERAAAEHATAVASLDRSEAEVSSLALELDRLRAEQVQSAVALEELTSQVEVAQQHLARLQGDDPDVTSRINRLRAEIDAVDAAREAFREHRRATEQLGDCTAAVDDSLAEAGFDTAADAEAASLADEALKALAHSVETHVRRRRDVLALIADPDLAAAADVPEPDVAGVAVRAAGAAAVRERAASTLVITEQARAALEGLLVRLEAELERGAPLRRRYELVDELSRCVDGTGGGNALRMRLSSFVLAARLEEVAAAASERLVVMSDGRYTLVHTDELSKGGARSGLGLRVVDGWTGVERDTSTLSGGESFLASLSLALGLADVVQAEAGGAAIETLFVDEGFGTLDDETLDEVMSVLDGLREGGRAVGLVSHVTDLRQRVPTQLEIRKGRNGSTVAAHGAAHCTHDTGPEQLGA